MKIVFAGTPDFAVNALRALIKHQDHDVVAVYTQPDRAAGRGKKLTASPVKQLAQENDLPVYQPLSLDVEQEQIIRQLEVDVMVVVAYGMLLPQTILDLPRHGCINIHASILPRWRGAAPIQRAIEAGDSVTGVSIMQMLAGLDTGPVFQTLETPIGLQDTSGELHDRLAKLGAEGIIDTLSSLATSHAQEQQDSDSSYAKKITKSEAVIDWAEDAKVIQRRIRAFIPWPVCQTMHRDTRIRIWRASVVETKGEGQPGEIMQVSPQGIDVFCGNGVLRLESLQKDGGKALETEHFVNGYSLEKGDIFGKATTN